MLDEGGGRVSEPTLAGAPQQRWCILRTPGQQTLKLVDTLTADGFKVWAPSETVTISIKGRIKRNITRPIMPGYVFVDHSRWTELLQLMRDIATGKGTGHGRPNHARFTVMKHGGKILGVSDFDMSALRRLSAKRTPMRKAEKAFGAGVRVMVKPGGGAFTGSVGKVFKSSNGHTLLFLSPNNGIRWKLPTSILEQKEVEGDRSNEKSC